MYDTRKDAEAVMLRMWQQDPEESLKHLNHYLCEDCGKIHVGHSKEYWDWRKQQGFGPRKDYKSMQSTAVATHRNLCPSCGVSMTGDRPKSGQVPKDNMSCSYKGRTICFKCMTLANKSGELKVEQKSEYSWKEIVILIVNKIFG